MGTWISHLRIAENLLTTIPGLDETAFTFGSLAPDSGLPNADWTVFDPPKSVSHFIPEGESEKNISDLVFYRNHLLHFDRKQDPVQFSFLLGYFFHLVTDRLWTVRVDAAFRVIHQDLFASHTEVEAINIIKDDMYGLDQRFVRDDHDCLFWRVFLSAPIPLSKLDFVRQDAFEHQMTHIRDFYAHPSADWVLDRPYQYFNEAAMTKYVEETSSSLAKVARLLSALPPPEALNSAIMLLTSDETSVFSVPISDQP
jgi:hypothetical protein